MIAGAEGAEYAEGPEIIIAENWLAELERLVPSR